MSNSLTLAVAAWGQYLHWAHLQFERYVEAEDNVSVPTQTAAVAHWLAAEFVVLEGWRELGLSGTRVSRLLDIYPEHIETLRRCRNAVYHFQKKLLDDRIIKCLQNEAEELTWSVALHEEFQRFLVAYPYTVSGNFDDQAELADELATCIGWFPEHTVTGSQFRVLRKCLKFEKMLKDNHTPLGDEGRTLAQNTAKKVLALTADNHLVALKRWSEDSKRSFNRVLGETECLCLK